MRIVLALNCGSSSLKFGLYRTDQNSVMPLREGETEEIGTDNLRTTFSSHAVALEFVLSAFDKCGLPKAEAVGHRFVHGGPQLREHCRATPEVLNQLRAAVPFAPLHLPPALSVLDAMRDRLPELEQVVCLDTAFHRTMPDVSKTFALPSRARRMGVERYGFHGLSLESIVAQLDPVPERLIVAHLGNGASITAIRNGQSIDTTMGLTPTGGVMMGTRCGDLDPGVLLYLMRAGFIAPAELEALVDHESGLLGISEKSSDVRELLAAREQNPKADLALRMFCYQVRKAIAAMASSLNGLDALVLTGGIGEHATELRNEICDGLRFLGPFKIMVLPSQEDLRIATITAGVAR